MFNYAGIEYRVFADGVFALILSIIILMLGKVYNKEKRDPRCITAGLVVFVYSVIVIIFYNYMLYNPIIECHVGEYIRENRNTSESIPMPFTSEYWFSDEGKLDHRFFLDSFSRKKIYNKDFIKGVEYRIYYEKRRNIIVRIEEAEKGNRNTEDGSVC